ncbi:hypothetical protein [Mycobacterium parmense]|uniref:hypothetical protein n=1 Tax=Mycobacterium parmense TaxID=185642 RepID=UPI0013748056|nr:hypothetical protein [Mycobacterium parmense]MCV7351108.1 hypothetical protein [Mycobacterium parmense]
MRADVRTIAAQRHRDLGVYRYPVPSGARRAHEAEWERLVPRTVDAQHQRRRLLGDDERKPERRRPPGAVPWHVFQHGFVIVGVPACPLRSGRRGPRRNVGSVVTGLLHGGHRRRLLGVEVPFFL